MRKKLQRKLNIYQMQLNDVAANTQSMLIEIRIIKRKMIKWLEEQADTEDHTEKQGCNHDNT